MRHRAELIPCSIIDEGAWRFRIKLGPPVPNDCLGENADWFRAGKFLIEAMLADFCAHPDQCSLDLLGRLKPDRLDGVPEVGK